MNSCAGRARPRKRNCVPGWPNVRSPATARCCWSSNVAATRIFFTRSADELVRGQYADRPQLREIYDAVLALLPQLGEVAIRTRKTYVALLTARRSFAVIAPVTRTRVDLGLRWQAAPDSPRLSAPGSRLGSAVTVKAGLRSAGDVDDLIGWLQQVYDANL